MKKIIFAAIVLLPFSAFSARWEVDHSQSHIGFAGEHAGTKFAGKFARWQADIDFDPTAPEKGSVVVTVDLASAATGDATYDATLPQTEWLNSAKEKQAVWQSTAIRKLTDKQYEAQGELKLKGKSVPVTILFGLLLPPDGTAAMQGTATLKRLDFDIGKESDAAGDWVSLEIPLDILVIAKPLP